MKKKLYNGDKNYQEIKQNKINQRRMQQNYRITKIF